jgi:hypothetical protein
MERTGIFLRKGLDSGIAEQPVEANQGSAPVEEAGCNVLQMSGARADWVHLN